MYECTYYYLYKQYRKLDLLQVCGPFISNDLDLPIFGFLEVTLMSTKLEKNRIPIAYTFRAFMMDE